MKLQIESQQWRLRISEDELQQLREGAVLASTTALPRDAQFTFELALDSQLTASIDTAGNGWTFTVPATQVNSYAQKLPSREGLHFDLPIERGPALQLVFEVDVRDSVRHRGATRRQR